MDPARPLSETTTPTEPPAPTATEVTYRPGIGVMAAIRPAPLARPFLEEGDVIVTVLDTDASPQEGLPVYAFDGPSYTGIHGTTDPLGQVTLNLPDSDYRFRSDLNGTQFWSGEANHCTVPGCTAAGITVSIPVTISVADTDGIPQEGLPVYAFSGGAYSGYHGTSDAEGEVSLTLPLGDYRFRSNLNGTQFWSGESDHCTVPGCLDAVITVTVPLTVTVEDTDGTPQGGLPVYAFDDETYTGYHGATDESGEAVFTLPQGSYRFRSDLNGTHFWSGEANHCDVPGCLEADVVVTIPLTVTVQSQTGAPYAGLPVYVFSGEDYTGDHGNSDENGEVVFTLPEGSFRFRTDYDGVQFWSGETDHCTVPGCLETLVEIPGGTGKESVLIDYEYDALYRLTAANYDTGEYFYYQYDAVGNRLEQETHEGTSTYAYDAGNRLIDVDGVAYTWSANGNLLSDGVSTYSYDHANRLISVDIGSDTYLYAYNGLGDRLAQSVNGDYTNYTLDIVFGLTQILRDGETSYLYGRNRISGHDPDNVIYFLTDALGSVRQLVGANASPLRMQSYSPFGNLRDSEGAPTSIFGWTGEIEGPGSLLFLRNRYVDRSTGRFLSMDLWEGALSLPSTQIPWLYGQNNPINYTDPSGLCSPELPEQDYQACIESQRIANEAAHNLLAEQRLGAIVEPLQYWIYHGSFSHSGQMQRWESDYRSLQRDVTDPPPGIRFNPSISMNAGGARNILAGQRQYSLSYYPLGQSNPAPLPLRFQGDNRCGHIVLAVILETIRNGTQAEALIRAIGFEDDPTTASQLGGGVRDVFGDGWDYWIYRYNQRFKLNVNGGHIALQERTSGNWFANSYDLDYPRQLSQRLREQHYLVLLTQINPLLGTLRPFSINLEQAYTHGVQSTSGHWVLLTGMSSTWNYNSRTSHQNWVRIYNPFWDRTEYYHWDEFYRSVSTTNMLEVWRASWHAPY